MTLQKFVLETAKGGHKFQTLFLAQWTFDLQ